jgi:dTDP-6-deoxy-L-talose 4-dehydrogenase (NAD+)
MPAQFHILVTGASGGLANGIIQALLRAGIRVTATSRSKEAISSLSFYNQVEFKEWDLNDSPVALYNYFGQPDAVLHLAWELLSDLKNPAHENEILDKQKMFLKNLIDGGLKDLTVVGTAYEYGMKSGECYETDNSEPIVPYGNGKNLLRIYLESLQKQHSFCLKWIRLFNVFSEGRKGKNLYSHLMIAIESKQQAFNMSGGEQIRDYMYGEEAANKLAAISLQTEITGIINCCSGSPIQLKDMILKFMSENGLHIPLNLGFYPYLGHEPMQQWGNPSKMNKALVAAQKNFSEFIFKTTVTSQ